MLTQEQLKTAMTYDKDIGTFVWNNKRGKAGHLATNGYLYISVRGKRYLAHRLAWLYVTGSFPNLHLDHINRVKDDNRFSNLREVTHTQNMQNKSLGKNNTTGFIGISKNGYLFWDASVHRNGVKVRRRFPQTEEGLIAAKGWVASQIDIFTLKEIHECQNTQPTT